MSTREKVLTRVSEAGGKLKVSSALNPVLWLCGITTGSGLTAMKYISPCPPWMPYLIFAPVFAAIFGFLFLLFKDRDKLQSEEYQIRKMEIEMAEEKGGIPIPLANLSTIENPVHSKLIHKEENIVK